MRKLPRTNRRFISKCAFFYYYFLFRSVCDALNDFANCDMGVGSGLLALALPALVWPTYIAHPAICISICLLATLDGPDGERQGCAGMGTGPTGHLSFFCAVPDSGDGKSNYGGVACALLIWGASDPSMG
jgi:hypothetical protein